ncbi:hypothetical protein AKJ09_09602 [Labilithrix luteola]|uniref:Uncharacterized protein n=1 Tax=Labilithrix luteola TaxID=1391654 RepID=A0A0K1QB22_9BACT|nr:hypothetical protein AKJ09_09602 [Labilithrix luteola]
MNEDSLTSVVPSFEVNADWNENRDDVVETKPAALGASRIEEATECLRGIRARRRAQCAGRRESGHGAKVIRARPISSIGRDALPRRSSD